MANTKSYFSSGNPGFIWLSRVLLFLAALTPIFMEKWQPQYLFLEGIRYIVVPLLIILVLDWIAPLLGSILALVTVPIWFYWLGISNSKIILAGLLSFFLLAGGILSLLGYLNQKSEKTVTRREIRFNWLRWLSRLLILAIAYFTIFMETDFMHLNLQTLAPNILILESLILIWLSPALGGIFTIIWVPLWYYWLNTLPQLPIPGPPPSQWPKLVMVGLMLSAVSALTWSWLNRRNKRLLHKLYPNI